MVDGWLYPKRNAYKVSICLFHCHKQLCKTQRCGISSHGVLAKISDIYYRAQCQDQSCSVEGEAGVLCCVAHLLMWLGLPSETEQLRGQKDPRPWLGAHLEKEIEEEIRKDGVVERGKYQFL